MVHYLDEIATISQYGLRKGLGSIEIPHNHKTHSLQFAKLMKQRIHVTHAVNACILRIQTHTKKYMVLLTTDQYELPLMIDSEIHNLLQGTIGTPPETPPTPPRTPPRTPPAMAAMPAMPATPTMKPKIPNEVSQLRTRIQQLSEEKDRLIDEIDRLSGPDNRRKRKALRDKIVILDREIEEIIKRMQDMPFPFPT